MSTQALIDYDIWVRPPTIVYAPSSMPVRQNRDIRVYVSTLHLSRASDDREVPLQTSCGGSIVRHDQRPNEGTKMTPLENPKQVFHETMDRVWSALFHSRKRIKTEEKPRSRHFGTVIKPPSFSGRDHRFEEAVSMGYESAGRSITLLGNVRRVLYTWVRVFGVQPASTKPTISRHYQTNCPDCPILPYPHDPVPL